MRGIPRLRRINVYMYPDVNHAFNNDTGGARYNKEAADLAWERTLAFFKENLGTPPRTPFFAASITISIG